MTTATERDNKQYLAMRRRQFITMTTANAKTFAMRKGPLESEFRHQLSLVANDCPGGPLTSKEIERIVKACEFHFTF